MYGPLAKKGIFCNKKWDISLMNAHSKSFTLFYAFYCLYGPAADGTAEFAT